MNEQKEKRNSLADFIKENHVLLSAVGILGGLAVAFGSLPISWLGYLLSFLMLCATALVWSEIKFKEQRSDELKLTFFKSSLKWSFPLIILYILLRYRTLSHLFLFGPIFIILVYLSVKLVKRPRAFLSSKIQNEILRKIIKFLGIGIITYMSLYLATRLSIPANQALDWISQIKIEIF